MTGISLGAGPTIQLKELLTTRLLVQGSSGSGKTHLLKRLLEGAAPHVTEVIVDPEGEFVYLANIAGHSVIDAERYYYDLPALGTQARERNTSVVLDLSGLEPAMQVGAVGKFLPAIFDAAREHWHPCLVAIDEAHLFASGEMAGTKLDRLASASALANLMSRGRKRGLAGIIATQRVSKIQKNVVAEALNFLVGRTFLDIDLKRTTNLLGLKTTESGRFRDLRQGDFVGFGPAIALVPTTLSVGPTAPRAEARPGDPLAPLTVVPSVPELCSCPAPRVEAPRLVEPLVSLLAWLRGQGSLDYLAAARAVPGVINAVHARALVKMLADRGYVTVTEGVHGRSLMVA